MLGGKRGFGALQSQVSFRDVPNELTFQVADIDDDGALEREALFSGPFEDWFWQYDNQGLKLAQLRF